MLVVVAGMPRSGSTFAFNVVREVLHARGSCYHEPSDDIEGIIGRSRESDHVIVKTHTLDSAAIEAAINKKARVIITVRPIEDALASWLKVFPDADDGVAVDIMRAWLRMYGQLRRYAVVVSYAQIERLPWLAAWRVARAVDRRAPVIEAIRIARRYRKNTVKAVTDAMKPTAHTTDMGFTFYDPDTLFHRRHVSGHVDKDERRVAEIYDQLRDDIARSKTA